jgi:hypothetical protein
LAFAAAERRKETMTSLAALERDSGFTSQITRINKGGVMWEYSVFSPSGTLVHYGESSSCRGNLEDRIEGIIRAHWSPGTPTARPIPAADLAQAAEMTREKYRRALKELGEM